MSRQRRAVSFSPETLSHHNYSLETPSKIESDPDVIHRIPDALLWGARKRLGQDAPHLVRDSSEERASTVGEAEKILIRREYHFCSGRRKREDNLSHLENIKSHAKTRDRYYYYSPSSAKGRRQGHAEEGISFNTALKADSKATIETLTGITSGNSNNCELSNTERTAFSTPFHAFSHHAQRADTLLESCVSYHGATAGELSSTSPAGLTSGAWKKNKQLLPYHPRQYHSTGLSASLSPSRAACSSSIEMDERIPSRFLLPSSSPMIVLHPSDRRPVELSFADATPAKAAGEGIATSAPSRIPSSMVLSTSSSSSSSSSSLALSTARERGRIQGTAQGEGSVWPVERALFTDPADFENDEIVIELSCEDSINGDAEEAEKETEEECVGCLEGNHSEKGFVRKTDNEPLPSLEEVRLRYASRLTEAESRNEELLSFLAWSERQEAMKKRTLYSFWDHIHPSDSTNDEMIIEKCMTKRVHRASFPSLDSSSRESRTGAYRDIYLYAYALSDFTHLYERKEGEKCGAVSRDEVNSEEFTPVVYIASPVKKTMKGTTTLNSNAIGARSLAPQSSPARFIEWISQHVDLYSDLVFPPELPRMPSDKLSEGERIVKEGIY